MKIRGNTVGTPIAPEKVLVKSENLTEEEKAIARANIGAASVEAIGDIESALDAIIEIQKSLVGGGGQEVVSFTVDDIPYSVPAGTTWEEIANQGLVTFTDTCIDCNGKRVLVVNLKGRMAANCTNCSVSDTLTYDDGAASPKSSDCPIDGEAYTTIV
jgi:hypothetical protein